MCRATHISGRIAVAGAFVAVALAATPTVARAGVYTVHSCRTPAGAAAPMSEWRVMTHSSVVNKSRSGCPGSAFELQMLAEQLHDANDYIRATFRAPADTDIQDYSIWRSAQVQEIYNYRFYEITSSEVLVPFEECVGTCLGKGGAAPFGSPNLVRATGRRDVRGLDFLLTCGLVDTSTEKCPATAPGGRFWLHRADVTLRDMTAPVLASPPTGPLVSASGPLVGVQSVSIAATDKGGGVYQAQLEVDGTIVRTTTLDENGGQCRPPFTVSVPCKLSASATMSYDTTGLTDGPHTLRILVTDATATNTAVWGPMPVVK